MLSDDAAYLIENLSVFYYTKHTVHSRNFTVCLLLCVI